MNLFQLMQQALAWLVSFFQVIWPSLYNLLHAAAVGMFREYLYFIWAITSALPLPAALTNPSLSSPGPIGYALNALGVPQAFGIISAAFTVKMILKLIPFIGR